MGICIWGGVAAGAVVLLHRDSDRRSDPVDGVSLVGGARRGARWVGEEKRKRRRVVFRHVGGVYFSVFQQITLEARALHFADFPGVGCDDRRLVGDRAAG